jgi:hypothetical protein
MPCRKAEELPGPCGVLRDEKGMHMTDRRSADQQSSNPEPMLKSKDRFTLGAIVFAVLIGGLLLYTTRPREEPTTQAPPISASGGAGVSGGVSGGGK